MFSLPARSFLSLLFQTPTPRISRHGLSFRTNIPRISLKKNTTLTLQTETQQQQTSFLQQAGSGNGANGANGASGGKQSSPRHHSEPIPITGSGAVGAAGTGIMYTTDIPSQPQPTNPKRSRGPSRDMSLLKSRGGYSMAAAGADNRPHSDQTGEINQMPECFFFFSFYAWMLEF